jgi:hypothetical protein
VISGERRSADQAAETRNGRIEPSVGDQAAPSASATRVGAVRPGTAGAQPLNPAQLLLLQRLAGNQAARELVPSPAPPAMSRPVTAVQRRVVPGVQSWLQRLLAARGSDLATMISVNPAARLMRLGMGDRMDTVATVRSDVDAFEVAVGASPGFGNPNAARIVSVLENSQAMSALGSRLVTLFTASVDPLIGLAAIVNIDADRVRAALQAIPGQARTALTRLATRLAGTTVPANLQAPHGQLQILSSELGAPMTAGVTPSTTTRKQNVEALLTPPAVAAARGQAAQAGQPPPAFTEAGYYDNLMTALHAVATERWRWADETNQRTPMDMSSGGRVERVAAEAKSRVDALFGIFGSSAAPTLRVGTNLFDQSARPGNAWDMARYFVRDSGYPRIKGVDEAHHAFGAARANELRDNVIDHYSNTLPAASGNAPPPDLDARLGVSGAERRARLALTDRMWEGQQEPATGRVFLTPREGRTPAETRRLYWNLFKTCVHEYLHTTAHPTYTAWYDALSEPHHKNTYQEGFTDWFTLKTWRSVFPEEVASNAALRQTVQGSAVVDLDAAQGDPQAYPEIREAELLEGEIGLPNMRAAYFRGNTAVLGGSRLPR